MEEQDVSASPDGYRSQTTEPFSLNIINETDLMLRRGTVRARNSFRGRSINPEYLHKRLRRRAVMKSGETNVTQSHVPMRSKKYLQDLFTTMVDVQWRYSLLVFSMSFVLSWFFFGCIWWLIALTHEDMDPDRPDGWIPCVVNINSFWSCFLFSVETQSTIGFGGRATTEECPEAIFVMCLQSIVGMAIQTPSVKNGEYEVKTSVMSANELYEAFMVGFVFAKMARPKQRTQTLLFSRYAVISMRDGQLCLMFRVGDMRDKSHFIGANIRAHLVRQHYTREGELISPFLTKLEVQADEYDSELMMIWPMVVVHKIDENSPFYNLSASDIITERFEVIVVMEGTTESTGQTSQARTSYLPSELLWGHRFQPLVSYCKDRLSYNVDYSRFHSTEHVDTPLCSARDLRAIQENADVKTGFK